MGLFQLIEETRCGMLEPRLAAERKVSFERDGLDASKACHISMEEMLKDVLQRVEAPAQEREEKRWRVTSHC